MSRQSKLGTLRCQAEEKITGPLFFFWWPGTCSNPNKVSFSLKLEVMGMSKFSTASKNIKN